MTIDIEPQCSVRTEDVHCTTPATYNVEAKGMYVHNYNVCVRHLDVLIEKLRKETKFQSTNDRYHSWEVTRV